MNAFKLVTAVGVLAATAACTQTGYDNTYAYNGNNTGYYRSNPNPYYASNNTYRSGYYNNSPSYTSSGNPFQSQSATQAQRRPNGDMDRDGVPNRYDRDANGDRIPDAFQR